MANISVNLASGKGYFMDLIPGYYDKEYFLYGPIYFQIQAAVGNAFGFSDFGFRSVGICFGLLGMAILIKLAKNEFLPESWVNILAAALICDPFLNRSMVNGRMEMIAFAFIVTATYVARTESSLRSISRSTIVGCLCGLALLTTPRCGPLLCLPILSLFNSRTGLRLLKWPIVAGLVALGILATWVYYSGGAASYFGPLSADKGSGFNMFVGINFFRNPLAFGPIIIFLGVCILLAFGKKLSLFLFSMFVGVVLFNCFIQEVGPYSSLVTPLCILGSCLGLADLGRHRIGKLLILIFLIIPGGVIQLYKAYDVLFFYQDRVTCEVRHYFASLEFSRAVAPFEYFFLLQRDGVGLVTKENSETSYESLIKDADLVVSDNQEEIVTLLEKGFVLRRTFGRDQSDASYAMFWLLGRNTLQGSVFTRNQ